MSYAQPVKLPALNAQSSKGNISLTPIVQPSKVGCNIDQTEQPLMLSSSNFFKSHPMVSNKISRGLQEKQQQQSIFQEDSSNIANENVKNIPRRWIIGELDARQNQILDQYRRDIAPVKNEENIRREGEEDNSSQESRIQLRRRRILKNQDINNNYYMNLSVSTNPIQGDTKLTSNNQIQYQQSIQSISESLETADESPESESVSSFTKLRTNKRSMGVILSFSPAKSIIPQNLSNSKEFNPINSRNIGYSNNTSNSKINLNNQSTPVVINHSIKDLIKPQIRDDSISSRDTKPELFQSWIGRKQMSNVTPSILSIPSDSNINIKSIEKDNTLKTPVRDIKVFRITSSGFNNKTIQSVKSTSAFVLPAISKGILKNNHTKSTSSEQLLKSKPKNVSFLNKVIAY